mgnify:CR=1 FL=1
MARRLNEEAFVWMVKMQYERADSCLNKIIEVTDNQIEQLVGYVQQMRLCQRRSNNKEFYDYREKALGCLCRINEERSLLTESQRQRLRYAETELAIVTSTYYYYVGLEQPSVDALMTIDAEDVKRDTAQFLKYLYNIGAGGIIISGSAEDIYRQEMDYLLRCYQIALRYNYPYFVANALESIADHIIKAPVDADVPLALVNPHGADNGSVAIALAEQSLQLFSDYGDVYQTAGAYRTLASCYHAVGDDEAALFNLHQALADTVIVQAPDLVASIYEQLSVAYAAIDDKLNSDYYRNLYLDLQEQTRQDRQLEARAGQLDYAVSQLNMTLGAVVTTIVVVALLLWLLRAKNRRQQLFIPLENELEQRSEQLAVSWQKIEKGVRRHLEQRAKVSLVYSLLPLIDRMVYAINRGNDKEYVGELIDQIEKDNQLLTEWIQLRQGQLSLHIESFKLQPLFNMVARSQRSFLMKGLTLNVSPTEATVKADRILTLFMLNTLADNARKFTDEGGSVAIAASETANYVELSVSDTGCGMSDDELAHVFDRQLTTHGFGLLNCKGIIERYRKLSQVFSVCTLQAESQLGKGSRFFFRLPKGIVHLLLLLAPLSAPWAQTVHHSSQSSKLSTQTQLAQAAIYADSAYFSNINGTYEQTLLFADSCRQCLNEHYQQQRPEGKALLKQQDDTSLTPPEILWLHDSVATNYNLILDMRNESAVAALALHQWQLYQYNNRIYTQLYKELSADNTLADYCRTMQQTKENRTVAVALLVITLLAILPVWYFYHLRPRLNARLVAKRTSRNKLELLTDELRRADLELQNLHVANAVLDNCLSTLKHETMYYPSRIRQLILIDDMESAHEVVDYYRELYNLLTLQAMSQVERVKPHLHPYSLLSETLLADKVLINYLFELLKRMFGVKQLELSVIPLNSQYIEISSKGTVAKSANYKIDYLLCKQIVRDHGEATNRRACSIRMEEQANGTTSVVIILPRATA